MREYKGTVIAVSHDRYFLRQIVNRVVEVAGMKLRDYSGDYNVCSLTRGSLITLTSFFVTVL